MSRAPRILGAVLASVAVLAGAASALIVRLDGSVDWRRLNDGKIRQTYGTDVVFASGFELVFRSGWAAGLRFESAQSRPGTLGLSASEAVFGLWGLEATVGRELRLGAFGLHARGGLGLYHYRQTVDYAYVQDYRVNRFAPAGVIAAGLRCYPWRFLCLSADARFVVMSVKPYGESVNLGGWRLGGGLGFVFGK